MAEIDTFDIFPRGFRQRVRRTRGPGPSLVLAHGFGDDGACFASFMQRFGEDQDIVAIDARGHGGSALPEDGDGSPQALADDVLAVMDALGLRAPILCGHSMGALTVLGVAALRPERASALVLEDPPPRWQADALSPSDEAAWRSGTRGWLEGLRPLGVEAIVAQQRRAAPTWPEVDLAPWARSKLAFDLAFIERRELRLSGPVIALENVTMPTLLVTGDPALGGLVTPEAAADFRARVPQAELSRIEGAGHSVRRDQHEAYSTVVRDFLARLR